MPGKAALLQFSRSIHLYFGLLISPALVFFAFTGAYQTLSLHEAASNYQPPAILASLGQIHKKQTYVIQVRRSSSPADAGSAVTGTGGRHDSISSDEGRPGSPSSARQDANPTPIGASNQAQQPSSALRLPADQDRPSRPDGIATPGRTPAGKQPMTLLAKERQHLPLKIFFVLVALGLGTNTLTGIYMAYKYDRNRLLVTVLLLAGAVLPLILVNF